MSCGPTGRDSRQCSAIINPALPSRATAVTRKPLFSSTVRIRFDDLVVVIDNQNGSYLWRHGEDSMSDGVERSKSWACRLHHKRRSAREQGVRRAGEQHITNVLIGCSMGRRAGMDSIRDAPSSKEPHADVIIVDKIVVPPRRLGRALGRTGGAGSKSLLLLRYGKELGPM